MRCAPKSPPQHSHTALNNKHRRQPARPTPRTARLHTDPHLVVVVVVVVDVAVVVVDVALGLVVVVVVVVVAVVVVSWGCTPRGTLVC